MRNPRSFSRRVFFLLFTTIALLVVIFGLSLSTLRNIIRAKDLVAYDFAADVIHVRKAENLLEHVVSAGRGYLISGDRHLLARKSEFQRQFSSSVAGMKRDIRDDPEGERLLDLVSLDFEDYSSALDRIVVRRGQGISFERIVRSFETELQPRWERLDNALTQLTEHMATRLRDASERSNQLAARAQLSLYFIAAACVALSIFLSAFVGTTLVKLYRDAREAVVLREDTIAIVSHDLRNPLSAILLSSEGVRKALVGTLERKKGLRLLDAMDHSLSTMRRLVSDLLDLSRMEAGQFPLVLEPIRAKDLIDEAIQEIQPLAQARALRVEKRLDPEDLIVTCDEERLLQVFSNLFGNAIKFTPEGGRISVTAEKSPRGAVFSIADTGPGIPAAAIPTLFDRYRQARAGDRKRGAGLGLFIAKGIVEAHGGRIWVESKEGRGTRISFLIPG